MKEIISELININPELVLQAAIKSIEAYAYESHLINIPDNTAYIGVVLKQEELYTRTKCKNRKDETEACYGLLIVSLQIKSQ